MKPIKDIKKSFYDCKSFYDVKIVNLDLIWESTVDFFLFFFLQFRFALNNVFHHLPKEIKNMEEYNTFLSENHEDVAYLCLNILIEQRTVNSWISKDN